MTGSCLPAVPSRRGERQAVPFIIGSIKKKTTIMKADPVLGSAPSWRSALTTLRQPHRYLEVEPLIAATAVHGSAERA